MNGCSFPGCTKKHYAKTYCHGHYEQIRTGRPLTALRNRIVGLPARIDAYTERAGACLVWVGTLNPAGYGTITMGGRTRLAHRVVYEQALGEIPDGRELDHVCHVRACVAIEHLRPVTHKQNQENPAGLHSNNKSGFRGVFWHGAAKKWCAVVSHHNQKIYLGLFDDPEEAAIAARDKRIELHSNNLMDRAGSTL